MKTNKYKNIKQKCFDSKKEYSRAIYLEILEKNREISNLKKQVKFELIPKQDGERSVNYIADFIYFDKKITI